MIEKNKKLVLLDAYAIIHRAYHALPEFATSKGVPTGALYGLCVILIKIIEDLKPDFIVACFDRAEPTHRHEVYEEYKAGRMKPDKNLTVQLDSAYDVFSAWGIPTYSAKGFEADDILGTIVEELKNKKDLEIIVASGDMDTMQLVRGKEVKVFTMRKGLKDTVLYDEKAVVTRFGFPPKLLPDFKGLRGDPSDNIKGIKGIGEKTATSLIATFGSIEEMYKVLRKDKNAYKKADLSERMRDLILENEEEAKFSKTLATIRRDAPIDFKLPKHWKENLEMEKLTELFKKLQFRTMGERVKMLVSRTSAQKIPPSLPSPAGLRRRTEFARADSREEREIELALWVADSDMTNPKMADVFAFTETDSIKEAWKVINKELEKRKVKQVYEEIEKPLMPVVEKMNERGVKIDAEALKKLSETYHKELKRLEKEIWQDAGLEFNINSPKQLGEILFEKMNLGEKRQKKTATGNFSTKESELEKLRDKHLIINRILDYRELQKLLSTYIDSIPKLLDKGSRLHSNFLQAGASTGRMASEAPNLQNIPNRSELGRAIRHAFIAEKGFSLISLDYSQMELRLAAVLSEDKYLLEIFKKLEDIHTGVAVRVFRVHPENVDKEMRRKAKIINFGILYGMGVNALKKNLGTDRKEAQEFYNNYFKTFSGLAKYLDEVKAEAERKGYTETLFGRRRYFAGLKSPLPFIRAAAERMAINAPIQGTLADVIKIAMKKIDEHIHTEKHDDDMRLILQVHDELVYEVKDELIPEAAKHFKKIMETVIPEKKMKGVPILAHVAAGKNWGEMKTI